MNGATTVDGAPNIIANICPGTAVNGAGVAVKVVSDSARCAPTGTAHHSHRRGPAPPNSTRVGGEGTVFAGLDATYGRLGGDGGDGRNNPSL
jgi:hypothetical protein